MLYDMRVDEVDEAGIGVAKVSAMAMHGVSVNGMGNSLAKLSFMEMRCVSKLKRNCVVEVSIIDTCMCLMKEDGMVIALF